MKSDNHAKGTRRPMPKNARNTGTQPVSSIITNPSRAKNAALNRINPQ